MMRDIQLASVFAVRALVTTITAIRPTPVSREFSTHPCLRREVRAALGHLEILFSERFTSDFTASGLAAALPKLVSATAGE